MAEKSSFFTSVNGDRKYKADEFALYFSTFIGNGVFPNPSTNLQVTSNGDMTVTVPKGFAFTNGYMYSNDSDLKLTLTHADSALNRIDRIVVRCDFVNREIKAYVKNGVAATNPVPPNLTRNASYYELGLADIYVGKSVGSVQQSNITDTRLNTNLCGIVTQTVKTIDTTTLYNQVQAQIDINKDYFYNEFMTWFDTIKGVLGDDVVGNLMNLIDINKRNIGELNKLQTTNKSNLVSAVNEVFQAGVSAKSGMVQAINSKKTVPNVTTNDNWNTLTQRVKDIKEGSGNAITSDVLSGKTFTNSDGIEYTGTMPNRGGAITVTPNTSNQVKNGGYYSGNITVLGDVDLVASNIRSGKNIFGVNGTLVEGKRWASGITESSYPVRDTFIRVDGVLGGTDTYFVDIPKSSLGFIPNIIYVHCDNNYDNEHISIYYSGNNHFGFPYVISTQIQKTNNYASTSLNQRPNITNDLYRIPFDDRYNKRTVRWIAYE